MKKSQDVSSMGSRRSTAAFLCNISIESLLKLVKSVKVLVMQSANTGFLLHLGKRR